MNLWVLQIYKQNILKIETSDNELYFWVAKIFAFASCIYKCTCVCARVRVCARACVRACVCVVRVRSLLISVKRLLPAIHQPPTPFCHPVSFAATFSIENKSVVNLMDPGHHSQLHSSSVYSKLQKYCQFFSLYTQTKLIYTTNFFQSLCFVLCI